MDVEKLIQAAKICTSPDGKCADCPMQKNSRCVIKTSLMASEICAISNHYGAILAAERSKAVQEVREWVDNNSGSVLKSENNYVPYDELRDKLDSMEKEEPYEG